MNKVNINDLDTNSKEAPTQSYIKVTSDGPYLVYGNPPIVQEIITPNQEGESWTYVRGEQYEPSNPEHCALCRCGASAKKPFCDGSHITADWDPKETASMHNILEESKWYEGPELTLSDDEKLCANARFCDAKGSIWKIVEIAENDSEKDLFFREAAHCPSGRLIGWRKLSKKAFEPHFKPSLGLIEDPQKKSSGPIWVKGGIRVENAHGKNYEIRNRITLCRCGQSSNKPFCDGTHTSIQWKDDLKEDMNDKSK